MNQEFDLAVNQICNEPIDDAVVEAAASRVWAKLAVEAGPAYTARPHITDCSAFQALIPEYRAGRLDEARVTLLKDHLHECVACRRTFEGRVTAMPKPAAAQKARPVYRLAAAAAIFAAAGVSVWIAYDRLGAPSGRAIVQSVNGSLFAISAAGIQPLAAGAPLPDGVEIRTAKDSTAMLELRDGSAVELRERSAFSTTQGGRDITVRLSRGSVIVQAAHRSSGHLFVITPDCRVAVTGTIFGVSAGAKGSRVSVVQGEVHVDQDNQEQILHPGNQVVTSPDLSPDTVREDVAWSRNHERYDGLLASLKQALSQAHLPDLRYESKLLGRLPANVAFFAGIPNLAQYLGEAETVFEKKMAQSPDLEAWWQLHGGRTAETIEKLRTASEYLGEEIAVTAVQGSEGPVFLSEIKKPGFAEFLKKSGLPAGEEERNGLVLFGSPKAVEQFSSALDSPNGAIQSTDFYKRVEETYHRGVGILICASLHNAPGADAMKGVPPMSNAEAVIFNETQVKGQMETRLSLTFNGPRTGIAAWLADPAPMGSLDYVSTDASAAAAAVVRSGGDIADQLKAIAPRELSAVREALASSLDGEFAIALDGTLMPVPSWKLVAEVYNPQAAEAALEKAVAQYATAPENAGHKPLTSSQETFEGRPYYTIAVPDGGPLLEFHYTFADGYLIAGPTRAVVARALQIKNGGNSLLRSSKIQAMMPRDHYTNFSLVFYQDLGPALSGIASFLPQLQGPHNPMNALSSAKPSLIAAYAEPDRVTFAANGDILGPAVAHLMRGDVAGAAGAATPFLQPQGTRQRVPSYR